ncbi:unnamed protein product [Cylicostephanus goldi]|uniref:Fucosyltransferase N-terminal domain-containing protein n=1 Tax=Cylicostephanus goldi TaxID=71465 RepID=A0A3P7N8U3_CYLGO|nr:unnamed protein product [Cylicostephanus goldi]
MFNTFEYSSNKEPSAFIIHGPNMDIADLPSRRPGTLIILLNMEAPFNAGTGIRMVPPDYFNAVITYRKDAHYYHPYAAFLPLNESNTYKEVITSEQVC